MKICVNALYQHTTNTKKTELNQSFYTYLHQPLFGRLQEVKRLHELLGEQRERCHNNYFVRRFFV